MICIELQLVPTQKSHLGCIGIRARSGRGRCTGVVGRFVGRFHFDLDVGFDIVFDVVVDVVFNVIVDVVFDVVFVVIASVTRTGGVGQLSRTQRKATVQTQPQSQPTPATDCDADLPQQVCHETRIYIYIYGCLSESSFASVYDAGRRRRDAYMIRRPPTLGTRKLCNFTTNLFIVPLYVVGSGTSRVPPQTM